MKKALLLLLVISFATIAGAQKKTFLRIYNLQGHKIAKGFFAGTNDSAILLSKHDSILTVYFNEIGIIKTRRSPANAVVTGGLMGGITVGILGFFSGEPKKRNARPLEGVFLDLYSYTPAEGLLVGFITGAAIGGAIGILIYATQKTKTFEIYGNQQNWLQQKPLLDKIPVYKLVSENDTGATL